VKSVSNIDPEMGDTTKMPGVGGCPVIKEMSCVVSLPTAVFFIEHIRLY
jgi:hypothetical protein